MWNVCCTSANICHLPFHSSFGPELQNIWPNGTVNWVAACLIFAKPQLHTSVQGLSLSVPTGTHPDSDSNSVMTASFHTLSNWLIHQSSYYSMLNQLLHAPRTWYRVYKNIHHTLSRHAAFQINKWKEKIKWNSWVKRDQLDVTCFIISLFNAQHVSDVNTSILRSLRLICW